MFIELTESSSDKNENLKILINPMDIIEVVNLEDEVRIKLTENRYHFVKEDYYEIKRFMEKSKIKIRNIK